MYRTKWVAGFIATSALALVGCVADDTDADPELSPPEIVNLADGQRSAVGDMAATEMAAEEPAAEESAIADGAADMASSYMGWTIVTDFVVAPDLGALPTQSTGYVYRSGSSVDEATALALAAALGVDPTPQERPEEYMVEWAFGPDDGTAPSLTIDSYEQHYWWYSSGWNASVYEDEPACVETVDSDGNVTVDCPDWEPEPPVGVPTAEEAEARSREIISAAGFDPEKLIFETSADEWYASVYAVLPIGDSASEVSASSWSFGFGGEGVLEYAGGSFIEPEAVGPYPLVDLATALERLDGWYLQSSGDSRVVMPAIAEEPAVDMPAVEESVDEETAETSEPAVEPLPEPAIEPDEEWVEPTPTEITVTLVDVQSDLWWVNDVDGNVWLLPAYRFIGDDGGWYTVPAVTDEYMVETPVYNESVPVEVDPVPEPQPIDDAGSSGSRGTVDASDELRELMAPVDLDEVDAMIIDTLERVLDGEVVIAEEVFSDNAATYGVEMRVVERDGESLAVTKDYRTDRINVVVVDGNVVAIRGIG